MLDDIHSLGVIIYIYTPLFLILRWHIHYIYTKIHLSWSLLTPCKESILSIIIIYTPLFIYSHIYTIRWTKPSYTTDREQSGLAHLSSTAMRVFVSLFHRAVAMHLPENRHLYID